MCSGRCRSGKLDLSKHVSLFISSSSFVGVMLYFYFYFYFIFIESLLVFRLPSL